MARYIYDDEALQIIDSYAKTVTKDGKVVVDAVRDIVAVIAPAADVVPRAEVEKIFAEIELEIKEALNSNYKTREIRLNNKHEKREIPPCYCGDEVICICDGKIAALRGIEYFLAELKKKYIGDK